MNDSDTARAPNAADPIVRIGSLALSLSKWARIFRLRTPAIRERLRAGYTGADVVFGKERPGVRPTSGINLRIGEHAMPIHRWAKLTAQKSATIGKRLAEGYTTVEAVFGPEPPSSVCSRSGIQHEEQW